MKKLIIVFLAILTVIISCSCFTTGLTAEGVKGEWEVEISSAGIEKLTSTIDEENREKYLKWFGEEYFTQMYKASFGMMVFAFDGNDTVAIYASATEYREFQKSSIQYVLNRFLQMDERDALLLSGIEEDSIDTYLDYCAENGIDWKDTFRESFGTQIVKIEALTEEEIAEKLGGEVVGDKIVMGGAKYEITDGKLIMTNNDGEKIAKLKMQGGRLVFEEYTGGGSDSDSSMYFEGMTLKKRN